mgnify:CR=1 FL=1
MKTISKMMLLGMSAALYGCPSDKTADAGAPAAAATATPDRPAMPPTPPPPPPLTAEERQNALYGFGVMLAERTPLKQANLTEAELAEVLRGLNDGVTAKEPEVKLEEYGPKVEQLLQTRAKVRSDAEKKKGVEFAAKAAKEKGAKKTASGLVYIETQAGKGSSPKATDTVSVHYRGTLLDGTEFDSSHKRGQPTEFPLNGVIKCWTEGVQLMKAGGKARLICPADIAYGDRGAGANIPGGATLIFEIELLAVKDPAPPKVPDLGVSHGPDDGHGH